MGADGRGTKGCDIGNVDFDTRSSEGLFLVLFWGVFSSSFFSCFLAFELGIFAPKQGN